ncbi:hypothetical protein KAR91_00345 [Candidatus Pacearchaeota archaeon]|nr:hypothetical protein [Candidatus Pacearchaeota archaeon]
MNDVKQCTKCGVSHPATLEYFHKAKKGKFGLASGCKKCRAKQAKEYHQKPDVKRRRKIYNARHYNTPEHIQWRKEYSKEYRQRPDVRKKAVEAAARHRLKPGVKERNLEWQREYRKRDDVKERTSNWMKSYGKRDDVKKRVREYQKEYYARPDIKRRELLNSRARESNYRQDLHDLYIKDLIAKRSTLSMKDITPEMIELKRVIIKIKRESYGNNNY